ncbi:MAG TPA: hypothetical protein DEP51_00080, partial [Clostridiales bacterium]|nr:hypothetical protein [Clostridiales bacterium]
SIYDGNDNKVYNENIKSSDYGIVSGKFELANEVNSGLYKLVVKSNENETTKQFKVNPYVTPKYEVKVDFDKQNYLVEDTAKITFTAKYFFGEAVKDANFKVFIDNKEYKTLKSDEQGIATIDYYIKEAKTYNIKVEAVDSSNYYVEATNSFSAGTDLFEIQLLPEYGTLSAGRKNDVYVFTSNADGTPVKSYITVSSNNFTKQIATDENGIGKFSIDIDQISNQKVNSKYDTLNYTTQASVKQFSIIAEDTNKNKIQKKVSLDIIQNDLLLSTDKVKYEQGEDIQIKVSSLNDNTKNIYFFKNDKLIKMLSTESNDTKINLDDNYGLIDIYVTDKTDNYKSNKSEFKKTIFVKPSKELNISINTDKQEYKPGEKINISFNTQDENKANVDSALLVSMLDNSVLNLANNDLSIDNIKLALQDIKFSNDLDAATLYSCIVNDKSEQTMMALLLKQGNKNKNISETIINDYEQREKAKTISIVLLIIIAIITIILLFIKFKVLRQGIKHLINFIIFDLLLSIVVIAIIEENFWSFDFTWATFAITSIVGLAIYILFISRFSKKLFRTSVSIILTLCAITALKILIVDLDVSPYIIAFIGAILLLILAIIAKFNQVQKINISKNMKAIFTEIIYILKYLGAFILSIAIGGILEKIFTFDEISIVIIIICTYIFNYLFNLRDNGKNKDELNNNPKSYIIIIFAIIGAIAVGLLGIMVFNNAKNTVGRAELPIDAIPDTDLRVKSKNKNNSILMPDESLDIESENSGKSSVLDGIESSLNIFSKKDANKNEEINESNNNEKVENEQEKNVDENIRNVFLESMCFIPELVTTGGNANIELKLSDNITTWTIQTVGNTKDGKIGYGMINNVKVFKDFFVDFELPKNLIETDNV